jgi:hypothetical protein
MRSRPKAQGDGWDTLLQCAKSRARFPARAMKKFAHDERQGLEADAIIHTSMNVCISSQHHVNLANLFETA